MFRAGFPAKLLQANGTEGAELTASKSCAILELGTPKDYTIDSELPIWLIDYHRPSHAERKNIMISI